MSYSHFHIYTLKWKLKKHLFNGPHKRHGRWTAKYEIQDSYKKNIENLVKDDIQVKIL